MYRILTSLLLLYTCTLHGQQSWCGYPDPGQSITYQKFLQAAKFLEAKNPLHPRDMLHIPVVIHVVAREGFNPVSQAQALQQIDVLNNDFAAKGDNIGRLLDEFKPIIAAADIHFCIATTDPAGQPTTGITFTSTTEEFIGTEIDGQTGRRKIQYDVLGGKDGWDASRYINIWVGECLDILGFTTLPGQANFEEEIGIIIDIHHFGSIGDAGYYNVYGRGHTLTHEMGHFFGLKHIWGEGTGEDCNDSDDIDDTPNAAGPYYGCPEGEQSSCGTNNMYQNFMDFTDDRCLAAFTHDQVARMHSALELYYPDLANFSACTITLVDFDDWFDHLTWSTDQGNNKIVIYNPEGSPGTKNVRVFSADGKLYYEGTWNDETSFLINLQNAAAGVYIVNFTMGDEYRNRKIVLY
ncbi:MAG TPA: zinc-dependent metalloprotease [Saprospiraceae bacterium]|nr:zinc-dependent metalloprotease [Saprospiraceae bacterium]